jgi:hypothetical protein
MPRDGDTARTSEIREAYDGLTLELERIATCASIMDSLADGQLVQYEHAEYLASAIKRHHADAMVRARALARLVYDEGDTSSS